MVMSQPLSRLGVRLRSLLLLLAALLGWALTADVARAGVYAYDGPQASRVGVDVRTADVSALCQFSDPLAGLTPG